MTEPKSPKPPPDKRWLRAKSARGGSDRARKEFRAGPWLAAAVVLASAGITAMIVALFLPETSPMSGVGVLLILAAAGPYGWALRIRVRHTLEASQSRLEQSLLDAQAAQNEQLARLNELTRQLKAHTRAFKLEQVEEEVYSEILGIDADDVAFMEWPEDGLRDSVHVYFLEGPSVTYSLTLDQMNQAAETINQRMGEHDREDGGTA